MTYFRVCLRQIYFSDIVFSRYPCLAFRHFSAGGCILINYLIHTIGQCSS